MASRMKATGLSDTTAIRAPDAKLIPLGDLPARMQEISAYKDKPVAVICHGPWTLVEDKAMAGLSDSVTPAGVAGTASSIAWILFVVGLILALVFFLRGRTPL